MRRITLLAAMSAVCLLAAPVLAADEEAETPKKHATTRVVVEKEGKATVQTDAKPRETTRLVRVKTLVHQPKVVKMTTWKSDPRKPGSGGGWLGVCVSPVPSALAAHLDLKGEGVMVRNLVKGSPAQKARLDRYDVIVAVGKDQVRNLDGFISKLKAHKPGDKVRLTLHRKGQKRTVTVTLGKPVDRAELDYVYDEDTDEAWQDVYRLHKGVFEKGPKGWTFTGPKGRIDLPKILSESLPKHPWADIQVHLGGGGKGKGSFSILRTVDGKTIRIEGRDGAGITVTRAEGGKTVRRKFKDADELRRKDADAYELYKTILQGDKGVRSYVVVQPGERGKAAFEKARAAAKRMREEAEKRQREIEEQFKTWADKARTHPFIRPYRIAQAPGKEARYQFDVDEKGRIKVEVRQGDSAAKLTFDSEEQMKKKAPKLYKAYEKLLRGEK